MRKSIRMRLQVWYALVLLGVAAGFAGILYGEVHAARFADVDDALESAVLYLEAHLRRLPPPDLDCGPGEQSHPPSPRKPKKGKGDDRHGDGPGHGPPPRPSRERVLSDLTLPRRSGPGGEDNRFADGYFGIWLGDGSLLKAEGLPQEATLLNPAEDSSSRVRLRQRGDYREAMLLGPRGTQILVGKSVHREQAEMQTFAWRLAGVGIAILAVGLAGGWLVSGCILRPVAAISATASAISATNLAERINPEKVDRELADLARVLNATFARLEAAFERQARFTADASHELRTPLAILRSHAELALARPRTPEEYQDTLGTCLRASERMTGLVEGLLTLARADAGKLDLRHEPVDLRGLAEESVALFRPMAEGKGIRLTARLTPMVVHGDPDRLAQVVTNLLSNAIQYNRPGGSVHVGLAVSSGQAVLAVADTGCGIPEADHSHIFERFFRVDKTRSRQFGGHGLGLAICHIIIEAHGGSINVESEPGRGSTFQVRLPFTTARPAT